MVAIVKTVAFQGIEALPIEVQVQIASGLPSFAIVGLPDKAVGESPERVRAALSSIGLALPPKKITINLSPADLQKEGSHFDLPVALGLLVALDALKAEDIQNYIVLGELSLDARLTSVSGVLPSALIAASSDKGIICPAQNGAEAAWAQDIQVIAAPDLISLINHLKGKQVLTPPTPCVAESTHNMPDMSDIKGQESAKRALEITAAGGHNLLLQGPPGAGKSMLAARLPGLLPPLSPREALEVTMVHSIAGQLNQGQLLQERPFRDPHHSASLPALVGGGAKAKPGEISLAHHGVLFLDELPEFSGATLETLRQPLETGRIMISRASAHVSYPARFQLVAAMNPCRCGHVDDPERACSRAPKCALDYQAKLSGPLLDRIDLNIFVPAVMAPDLSSAKKGESTAVIAKRVAAARRLQEKRYQNLIENNDSSMSLTNANISVQHLEQIATLDGAGQSLLNQAADRFKLSARGYHRILRVARTLADLENSDKIHYRHIGEAVSYRQLSSIPQAA
ncbi:MAG: YifB family Mg chelatase-like AAA ATPase [Alphaproteobacteria bacterium]|nr:YifB family Mg chelatase-like AAA ATPase [Alphaproteobacteria bacterium]